MSGHSKWSTIKHKKAAQDAKRGKIFTKIIKELTVAARLGGGDLDSNPRLRSSVAAAKAANMPADNIKRAMMKGTGDLPGMTYDEIAYEGYAPGGVAVYVESLTDNRMRTTPEIRHLFAKHGGSLAEPNAVAWMFAKRGQLGIAGSQVEEDRLLELVLEAGADDLRQEGDRYEVLTSPEAFLSVQKALEDAGVATEDAAVVMEPQNTVALDAKKAESCVRLLEALEDHDDVQNVYANLEIADDDVAGSG
jgi:YebC/PmpR family DNA-binding regulatory protein